MTKKTKINLAFLIIVFLSIFFRFYELEIRTVFSYDQEATPIAIQRILVDHRPTLIGVNLPIIEDDIMFLP